MTYGPSHGPFKTIKEMNFKMMQLAKNRSSRSSFVTTKKKSCVEIEDHIG
jgi:hypothetical protein